MKVFSRFSPPSVSFELSYGRHWRYVRGGGKTTLFQHLRATIDGYVFPIRKVFPIKCSCDFFLNPCVIYVRSFLGIHISICFYQWEYKKITSFWNYFFNWNFFILWSKLWCTYNFLKYQRRYFILKILKRKQYRYFVYFWTYYYIVRGRQKKNIHVFIYEHLTVCLARIQFRQRQYFSWKCRLIYCFDQYRVTNITNGRVKSFKWPLATVIERHYT